VNIFFNLDLQKAELGVEERRQVFAHAAKQDGQAIAGY
jgi:hypothetical protein